MKTNLANQILNSPTRIGLPIGVYSGLEITGSSVRDAVSSAAAQTEAILAIRERFGNPFMLTAMDLSAEAETFGCEVRMADDEIPTVIGRKATTAEAIAALPDPKPGDLRTSVHLDTARNLAQFPEKGATLGGCIGPFSLAGRIFGVSEALEATLSQPDLILSLLDKVTRFLIAYSRAFKEAGASGLIMAEPAAGLLSPRGLARFSAPFVRQIVDEVQTERFSIILHNCGAKIVHFPKVLESGAEIYHFGAPMDLEAALKQAEGQDVILCGNLDPTAVFHSGTVDGVYTQTRSLMEKLSQYKNYVISSGCDLPPGTPVANLDAFWQAVREN